MGHRVLLGIAKESERLQEMELVVVGLCVLAVEPFQDVGNPAENVSKQHNHGEKFYWMASPGGLAKGLILRVYEVLMRDRSPIENGID